jgi:tetratricopeptide (TPR) repeat protein
LAAFVMFGFALLSKTVTCSLPVALLLIRWFRKRPIDVAYGLKLIPFFAVGLVMGLFTAYYERQSVQAVGPDWDFSFAERVLIAGRALWFYPAKLLWPSTLTFIYPRWDIDTAQIAQWIAPIAAAVLAIVLFALGNRIGRAPFAAVAFTFATLFPALGFINVYPMRYSFVADHFQYLASLGLIVLFSAIVAKAFARFAVQAGPIPYVAGAILILPLAWLTFQQGRIYENTKTLWEDTLAKNPRACIAYIELGNLDLKADNPAAARARFEKCLEIDPGFPEANTNVGTFLAQQGQFIAAIDHYKTALKRKQGDWLTLVTLTHALNQVRAYPEAETYGQKAVEVVPTYADAYRALAMALQGQGRLLEAEATFRRAVDVDPGFWSGWSGLGVVLMDQGRYAEAVDALRRARTIEPRSKNTQRKLAEALYCAGLRDEATQIDPQVAQRTPCVTPAADDSPTH